MKTRDAQKMNNLICAEYLKNSCTTLHRERERKRGRMRMRERCVSCGLAVRLCVLFKLCAERFIRHNWLLFSIDININNRIWVYLTWSQWNPTMMVWILVDNRLPILNAPTSADFTELQRHKMPNTDPQIITHNTHTQQWTFFATDKTQNQRRE